MLRNHSLARRLQTWTDQQQPGETIGIVGGGELINAIRHLDGTFHHNPEWVHWQCVGLLQITFQWLGHQLPDWQLHKTQEEYRRLREQVIDQSDTSNLRNHLVAVDSFYFDGIESKLPLDWNTTTDAIAGWLSIQLQADELVLLKSCDVDDSLSLQQLADEGIVDSALPVLAEHLPPVRFVNFNTPTDR